MYPFKPVLVRVLGLTLSEFFKKMSSFPFKSFLMTVPTFVFKVSFNLGATLKRTHPSLLWCFLALVFNEYY